MIEKSVLDIFNGTKVTKNLKACGPYWSSPCFNLLRSIISPEFSQKHVTTILTFDHKKYTTIKCLVHILHSLGCIDENEKKDNHKQVFYTPHYPAHLSKLITVWARPCTQASQKTSLAGLATSSIFR